MSDTEEEWKPNGRPQSTMARSLAAALDNAFMLDSEVDHLTTSVHYKKQLVTIQNRELEALEARIREAENRLKQSESRSASPEDNSNGRDSPQRRQATSGAFSSGEDANKSDGGSPLSSPTSERHRSGGSTDSSGSAVTSSDSDAAHKQDEKGKDHS
ncbi:hypothetical protein FQN55_008053 [Onygenales sp. PD_40]|nr:hypothetical protein FQN55_008053 [Onygenales sp. PD_40]KAK2774038.1 hypothetical protein FQN52_004437 [Onygenales sp. PD_12]KAK2790276.1 hypothetical protein FQN53_000042 [Emmonsiellopsis sp. PD_33]KAK2806614.1 hypothetical protein FQN51_006580 [Onygenales sp. PD_10]